jgi:hypothetical protein
MTLRNGSLQHHLHAQVVATTVSNSKKVWIIVEGNSDVKFLSHCFELDEFRYGFISANSKDHVLAALDELVQRGRSNFVCLVDVDLDFALRKVSRHHTRLCYVSLDEKNCDCIDLESALFRTVALRKVLVEYELITFDNASTQTEKFREAFRKAAAEIGAVRFALAKMDLRKQITDGHVLSAFDASTQTLRQDDFLSAIIRLLPDHNHENFRANVTHARNKFGSAWQLCRGHDLSLLLADTISFKLNRTVASCHIERQLRIGCERDSFEVTLFGRSLRQALQR